MEWCLRRFAVLFGSGAAEAVEIRGVFGNV